MIRLGTVVTLLAAVSIAVGQPGEHGAQEVVSLQDAPHLEGTIDLRIGRLEGEAPYLFGRITDVALDAAGRIYVADMQTHDIRVFDASGTHLTTAGGEGEGPGKFWVPDRPCEITTGAGGLRRSRDHEPDRG